MKEFKYTIDGKEYQVAIQEINENNVASICVNGEEYKVQLEQKEKEEKLKVLMMQRHLLLQPISMPAMQ